MPRTGNNDSFDLQKMGNECGVRPMTGDLPGILTHLC